MAQSNTAGSLLLIDDDNVYLMLCQRTIERSGKFDKIRTFSYAEEALTYLHENQDEDIDLIFLDINMPRMNGFEFLEKATATLKESFQAKVVIMLTTSIDPNDIEASKKFPNVKGYIAKPLTDERFERAIKLIQNTEEYPDGELAMIDTDQAA